MKRMLPFGVVVLMTGIVAAESNETLVWQAAIDAASAAGGGTVTVPAGEHPVAELELKSNVTLELAEGARLTAVHDYSLYRCQPDLKAELQRTGVVVAYGATNIALVGKGVIDGGGDREEKSFKRPVRWRNVYFEDCRGVRIEGVRMENAAFWTCFLRRCDGVHVKGLTIRSTANYNNDGLDLCVSNALIEDCDIISEDDAIVMKNFDPDWVSEKVEIRNCRLSSNATYIKFGTETFGVLRDFDIHDCELVARSASFWRRNVGRKELPGLVEPMHATGGLSFLMVDGGILENIRVRDITMGKGVCEPLIFRLGRRNGSENWGRSAIRGITLERIRMTEPALCGVGSFISGVPGLDIADVTIRDSSFRMQALAEDIGWRTLSLPEREGTSPGACIFGGPMPAHFLYVRHARNVRLENVTVEVDGEGETRPAVVADGPGAVTASGCAFEVVNRRTEAPETAKWQAEIDAAAAAGGGTVTVPKGRHLVGQLELRSNVELHLEEGAVLEGAYGMGYYHPLTLPYSEGVWAAVVSAIGMTNVAITGKGTIDGRGGLWPQPRYRIPNNEGHRPRGLLFADCRDVRLEDFTFRDAVCWGVVFKRCTGVRAVRVTVDNHANANNDGFDIEAWDAVFEDCVADSGDDAFCFKSNDPHFKVGRIVVRNCLGRSQSNCYKLGTATHGVVKGIRIENCRATLASRDFISTSSKRRKGKPFFWREKWSELYPNSVGKTALAIQNVDGGDISDIVVDGFTFDGYLVPFCIRGGRRQHRSCDIPPNDLYRFHDISISHVRGKALTSNPSWIVGVDGCRVKNVSLKDVEIECVGEGDDAREISEPGEDQATHPPMAEMFVNRRLPAYGLYIDKADGVTLEDVRFPLRAGTADARPATYDSRTDAKIEGLIEPDAKRNLKLDPAWQSRFRTLKSVADGTTQPFYWYDPGTDGAVPLVVALHSWGASCHWSSPAKTVVEHCKKHGWAMVYPNFRGPNVRPEACGSDLAVQDILDTIAWAKKERRIDADRVYITGGSGGGYMTLLMAGRFPEVFAGAAAFCPITDLARWHADSTLRKNHYAGNIAAACGGLPDECLAEYQKRSALTYLGNARANGLPVYIATGIHDGHRGSVPVGHSIRAFNAMADEADRISEEDIAFIEANEAIPEALKFKGSDPFYGPKTRVHLRATSANARLTVFEAGHSGNYAAGLDFLSRQRRGRPADMTIPEGTARTEEVESITK